MNDESTRQKAPLLIEYDGVAVLKPGLPYTRNTNAPLRAAERVLNDRYGAQLAEHYVKVSLVGFVPYTNDIVHPVITCSRRKREASLCVIFSEEILFCNDENRKREHFIEAAEVAIRMLIERNARGKPR